MIVIDINIQDDDDDLCSKKIIVKCVCGFVVVSFRFFFLFLYDQNIQGEKQTFGELNGMKERKPINIVRQEERKKNIEPINFVIDNNSFCYLNFRFCYMIEF